MFLGRIDFAERSGERLPYQSHALAKKNTAPDLTLPWQPQQPAPLLFAIPQGPSLQKTSQRVVIEITDAACIDWVTL